MASELEGFDSDSEEWDPSEWTLRDEETRSYVGEASDEVASLVRSTLGPRGREKLIKTMDLKDEREVVLAKDGNEILDAIERGEGFNHPAAALFIDYVDSMQRSLDDGTTTAILFTNELIQRGIDLIEQGLHPTNIILGYSIAANKAGQVLDDLARPVTAADRELIKQLATTTFPADLPSDHREDYAEMTADIIYELSNAQEGWIDTEHVKILSGVNVERNLHQGLIVNRYPQGDETMEGIDFDWEPVVEEPMYDATVAIFDKEIELAETAASFETNSTLHDATLNSVDQVESYRNERKARMHQIVGQISDLGVDILVCHDKIEGDLRKTFEKEGIVIVDQVNKPEVDIERLANATGGAVVSRVDELTPERLGTVGRFEEVVHDDEKWAYFDECTGDVFTAIANADTTTKAERNERQLRRAIEVSSTAVMDEQVIPGAGAPQMAVASALRDHATTISSREQLVIEAFADALEEVLAVFAENNGGKRAAVQNLRVAHAQHEESPAPVGLSLENEPINAWDEGVIEPRRVFSHAIETARAAAEQLVTVDTVIYPNVEFDEYVPMTEHQ